MEYYFDSGLLLTFHGKEKRGASLSFWYTVSIKDFYFYFFPKGDKKNKKDIEILLLIEIWLETDVMSTVEN